MRKTKDRSTHRGWVTAALLMSTFMTAIEVTIVGTAIPRIVADLGGFSLLSWVFSGYLLTQVISIPIYGKLADLYGRKPVFLSGVTLFLIASVLCGTSTSMHQLIAYRFLQGLGGGAVQPIAMTIIGDLYKPEERHRVQGWVGSIFALSSILGPAFGAFIVDIGHWPWIFYLNVPLGILAFALLSVFLREGRHSQAHRIDYEGAALLMLGSAALMLILLETGTAWALLSWQNAALAVIVSVIVSALIRVEKYAREPVLPMWLFREPLIVVTGLATFLNGAIMMGYSATVPAHAQGVLGAKTLAAGVTIGAMSIGWPLASFLAGRLMQRVGYRKTAMLGSTFVLLGGTLAVAASGVSPLALGGTMFVIGLGLGFQANAYIITIQSAVAWNRRGVATANNLFMRTFGSTLGVAALGGVLNSTIVRSLGSEGLPEMARSAVDLVNKLLDPMDQTLSAANRLLVSQALSNGMHAVFLTLAVMSLLGLVLAWRLPHHGSTRSAT